MLSCLIPITLGIVLLCNFLLDPQSPAFVFTCLVLGSMTILTGILGMVGVFMKVFVSLEVTGPLLVSVCVGV